MCLVCVIQRHFVSIWWTKITFLFEVWGWSWPNKVGRDDARPFRPWRQQFSENGIDVSWLLPWTLCQTGKQYVGACCLPTFAQDTLRPFSACQMSSHPWLEGKLSLLEPVSPHFNTQCEDSCRQVLLVCWTNDKCYGSIWFVALKQSAFLFLCCSTSDNNSRNGQGFSHEQQSFRFS